jgi:hypothetical protein
MLSRQFLAPRVWKFNCNDSDCMVIIGGHSGGGVLGGRDALCSYIRVINFVCLCVSAVSSRHHMLRSSLHL